MYDGKLVAHPKVASRTIADLSASDWLPLMMVDTAGALMHEEVEESSSGISESKSNVGEADIAIQIIKELKSQGITEDCIGVISPYSAQVTELKRQLKRIDCLVEVSTVDGF